ncbi:MAG: DUF4426 domain-containing protein [Gammaproteobacteria bacterium]|jgi:hypothetical protein|nr:MAG: DUF4426 domain-containing protein [Gammaproteobacteria bacterium]
MNRNTFSAPRKPGALFTLGVALLVMASGQSHAEQKQMLGPYEAHYVVVPSTFFSEEVAEKYGIVRGRDRALMNLSFLDESLTPVPVQLTGISRNLLSQEVALEFREVREGAAIYYLAEVRHTDRETLRFRIEVTTPDGEVRELAFQQQMFWDGR